MHSYQAVSDEGRNGQAEGWRDGKHRASPELFALRDGGQQQNTYRLFFPKELWGSETTVLLPPPPPPPCLISHWELRVYYNTPKRSKVEVQRPKARAGHRCNWSTGKKENGFLLAPSIFCTSVMQKLCDKTFGLILNSSPSLNEKKSGYSGIFWVMIYCFKASQYSSSLQQ